MLTGRGEMPAPGPARYKYGGQTWHLYQGHLSALA